MRRIYFILLLILWVALCQNLAAGVIKYPPLNLVKVYPVDNSDSLDLSGLDLCKGALYTVSDDKNGIFRIEVKGKKATLMPFIELVDVPLSLFSSPNWDWEGISCDSSNGFYLVSEEIAGILKVSWNGKMHWVSGDLYNSGREAGFFQKKNAFVEGITSLPDNSILVAAEREPRGLIKLNLNSSPSVVRSIRVKPVPKPRFDNRNVDFSGLDTLNGALYTLERNAQMICKRDLKRFEVQDCRGFGWVENKKKYRYKKMKYGHAEGLAVTESRIYIILDNNGSQRVKGKLDRRSLLLEFRFPISWLF